MLPRPLLLVGCFIMAMFAGWTAREAKTKPAETPQTLASSSAASATALTMPAGLDDEATRMWLADHLADATSEQLNDIATSLLTVSELSERAWTGLFACWFEKDPTAAWAFASTKPEQRLIALREWAALEPTAARAALTSPTNDDWVALVDGTMRKDMAATFRLTDEALAAGADLGDVSLERNNVVYAGLLDFATLDPDATAAWAEKLGLNLAHIQGELLLGRWKKNPASAKEWLAQQTDRAKILSDLASFANAVDFYQPALMDLIAYGIPAGNERIQVIEDLLQGLAWKDPDFAGKEAARVIPDPSVRANLIGQIASLLADTDFNKAWALLDTLDPSLQWSERGNIPEVELHVGTESGSVSAPWNYRSHFHGPEPSLNDEKGFLLYRLMQSDKEEAVRVMEGLPADGFDSWWFSAHQVWMDHEPEQALRWLAGKLGTGGGYGTTSGDPWFTIERTLSDFTPEQRSALLEGLPPGSVRTVLVTQRAAEIAEDDPVAALQYARETDTAEHPVARVYQLWAFDDPSGALKHLSEDSEAPIAAWQKVADAAYEDFPEQVSQALLTLPSGAGRDAALQTILKSMEDFDPSKSSALAFALGDPNNRNQAIEAILTKLSMDLRLAADPATADALKQHLEDAADISEAERQHWLERINSECTAP